MDIGVELHNLLPLDVGEHHEGVHRPLDVVWGVLLRLKNGISSIIWEIIIGQEDSLSKSEQQFAWLGAQETKVGCTQYSRADKMQFWVWTNDTFQTNF